MNNNEKKPIGHFVEDSTNIETPIYLPHDAVNHPHHYTNSNAKCAKCDAPIECIDITRHMCFDLGNAVKYIWRYADKNGLEDLRKAAWYLNDFIENKVKK